LTDVSSCLPFWHRTSDHRRPPAVASTFSCTHLPAGRASATCSFCFLNNVARSPFTGPSPSGQRGPRNRGTPRPGRVLGGLDRGMRSGPRSLSPASRLRRRYGRQRGAAQLREQILVGRVGQHVEVKGGPGQPDRQRAVDHAAGNTWPATGKIGFVWLISYNTHAARPRRRSDDGAAARPAERGPVPRGGPLDGPPRGRVEAWDSPTH